MPVQQPSGTLTTSDQAKALARALVHVNRFVGFPIPGEEIVAWAGDIERLAPNSTVEELAFLMDRFKTGELEWDKQEGITNIFRGLRRVRRDEDGELYLITKFW